MMKKLLFLISMLSIWQASGQNDLLSGAIPGNITAAIYDFEFVYDGSDLVLVAGSYNTGFLYAIDHNEATADGVHDWNSNTIPDILGNVADILGASESNLTVWDMKVNPKTKAVVLLVFDDEASDTYLFEAKNPENISLISLNDVNYSRVKYTTDDNYIHDIEWSQDEGKLYYSQGDFTLDASVGYVEMPFVHNSTATIRATSVFKSNWGGNYFTSAPLEKLSVAKVNGTNRLMGVTTCAPGFSVPTAVLSDDTDVLSVSEDFNVHFSRPLKTVAVTQTSGSGTATYLFDLHQRGSGTQIIRVGEKYLTGTIADTNNLAQMLRTPGGNIIGSLTEDEAMELALNYAMIAYYSDYEMMVIDDNDVLRLIDVTSSTLSVENEIDLVQLNIVPNPAQNWINVSLSEEVYNDINYSIYDMDGKLIQSSALPSNRSISIESLEKGSYILALFTNDGGVISNSNFIKA